MYKLSIFICLALFCLPIYSQNKLPILNNKKDKFQTYVSFFKDTPIKKAFSVIDTFLVKYENKRIKNKVNGNQTIGKDIENTYYRQALQEIVDYNHLQLQENDSLIIVSRPEDDALDTRQVNIDAIFFEANITKMKEHGINWNALFSKSGLIINPSLNSGLELNTQRELGPDFKINTESASDLGKFSQYTTALLNFFEQKNMGRLLAKLSLTVRDGHEGRIQVGSDFSVKQYDFAGNVIDRFYPTGTIIKVVPHIHKEDTLSYALLNLDVEKSIFIPGAPNNEIKKETANTDVLLFNNEEAIVGGLMTNETENTRGGIPVLKDLPWWVFGLRYLTGYDQKQVVEKEVIILVKIEIIPTLRERIKMANKDLIKNKLKEDRKELKKYKMNFSPDNNH